MPWELWLTGPEFQAGTRSGGPWRIPEAHWPVQSWPDLWIKFYWVNSQLDNSDFPENFIEIFFLTEAFLIRTRGPCSDPPAPGQGSCCCRRRCCRWWRRSRCPPGPRPHCTPHRPSLGPSPGSSPPPGSAWTCWAAVWWRREDPRLSESWPGLSWVLPVCGLSGPEYRKLCKISKISNNQNFINKIDKI